MSDQLYASTDKLLRKLLRREAAGPLRKLLRQSRTQDVAAAMEHLTSEEQRRLYALIEDRDFAAEVLAHLDDVSSREVVRGMDRDDVIDLLDRMDPDDATDVVEALDETTRAEIMKELSDDETAEAMRELLEYEPDTAGGLMSPNVFKLREGTTCGQAINALREQHEDLVTDHYVYVVDGVDHLLGVLSLRSLIIHSAETPLSAVMTRDVISVGPNEDQEVVAKYVARYDLLAIPVLDEERCLLGIVTVDDVLDVLRDEHNEDVLLMVGVVDEGRGVGLLRQGRDRGGWLFATIGGGVLASEIITHYTNSLQNAAFLAGFIPVIMGMGGNVGLQSATIAVRGLATGQIQHGGPLNFIWRESRIGMLMGLFFATLLGVYGAVRFANTLPMVGLAVGFSVMLSMSMASALGATIPVVLSRLKIDPAIATGPFVSTTVDVLGIVVYFNVARILLGL